MVDKKDIPGKNKVHQKDPFSGVIKKLDEGHETAGGAAKQVILYSIHTSTVIEAADILSIKLNDSSTVMKIRGSMLPFTIDNMIIDKVEILTSDDDSGETIAVLAFL